MTLATEGPIYLKHDTRLYNCNDTSNYDDFYPNLSTSELAKVPGVCGSLSCAVVVAYFDDYYPELAEGGDFATNSKKTAGSNTSSRYGFNLVKEFVPYIEPSGNGSFLLSPGMADYLLDHDIKGGLTIGVLTVYQQTKNAISKDIPIIVGSTTHYCVGIGYKNISKKQIYVNNGWGGKAWINADTIVSTWTLALR